MHTPGHEAGADQKQYGLGFNVEHVLSLTGWSFSQVAEQMYPHHPPDGPHRVSARKGLAQVTKRKQKHWRRHLPRSRARGICPSSRCSMMICATAPHLICL
jgi:hypothetical protein